jgi:competence protein ComEA
MSLNRKQLYVVSFFVIALGVLGFAISWLNQPTTVTTVVETVESISALPDQLLVIDVQGEVRSPGVYELPQGSRVFDAITAAGGLIGKATAGINQARFLEDGEQLLVGVENTTSSNVGKLNLNTATAIELETLPGVGPVLANRIIQDREVNGRFKSVADLDRVSGVGPHIMQSVSELVIAQ